MINVKANDLIKGLKSNTNELAGIGLNDAFITELENSTQSVSVSNDEITQLRAQLRSKSVRGNRDLMDLKKQILYAKKLIKRKYDKTEWNRFGIKDKK